VYAERYRAPGLKILASCLPILPSAPAFTVAAAYVLKAGAVIIAGDPFEFQDVRIYLDAEARDAHVSARRRAPNTTATGALACAFGTPWLDHFQPPIGNGRGCAECARHGRPAARRAPKRKARKRPG